MPVAREKGGRRRTASSSSDCGLQAHFSPPKPRFLEGDLEQNDAEGESATKHVVESFPQCCNPKGCLQSEFDPANPEVESVKMTCSNEKCPFSPFMHGECFLIFEEQMLSCLRGMSRARNWSEKQRKQNLWTKKGYDLIFKMSMCRCGRGSLKKDLNYVPESTDKLKRKRKKSTGEKNSQSGRATNGAPRAHSRSGRNNSDSVSSENGLSFMQPFSHRSDYSVFQKLVPKHLVNSYHIKMEDDGYGAGDETRSFVLSSLAFHRTNTVACVLCSGRLQVYDQYPLLDGTFYLSPVKPSDSSFEVESKGDDPLYLSAVCLQCLVGRNKVICGFCSSPWNGNYHQIGTMYSYDLFAALPCCSASVCCNKCKKGIVDPAKVTLSFSQLSSQAKCSHCGSMDYHFVKPISRFQVKSK